MVKLPTHLMGTKGQEQPPPPYRDNEASDSVSLHTQNGDYSYDDDAPDLSGDLPAYEDTPAFLGDNAQHPASVLASHNFADMKHCGKDKDGISRQMNPRFDSDPEYVEQIIRVWAQVPPEPMIQITGTHTETTKNGKKEEKNQVTDFDVKLPLGPYLRNVDIHHGVPWRELVTAENGEKTYRGTVLKKRAPGVKQDLEIGTPKPDLREWSHRYCASHSRIKTFRFERRIIGLDQKLLTEKLQGLVKSTNYRGHITISFPVEERGVEVYSDHWVNRWRMNRWICLLFYITFLWLFTWPYLFFATKRFAVVRVEWPWSRLVIGDGGERYRAYGSMSEEELFGMWAKTIEKAVCGKQQRVLTVEDRLRVNEPEQEFRSGNGHVDTAVGWLVAGARGVSEVQRSLGWGGDC